MKKDFRKKGDRRGERCDRYRGTYWSDTSFVIFSLLEWKVDPGTPSSCWGDFLSLLVASPALWSFSFFSLHLLRHSSLARILIPSQIIWPTPRYLSCVRGITPFSLLRRTCISRCPSVSSWFLSSAADRKIIFPCAIAIALRLLSLSPSPPINLSIPIIICPLCSLPPVVLNGCPCLLPARYVGFAWGEYGRFDEAYAQRRSNQNSILIPPALRWFYRLASSRDKSRLEIEQRKIHYVQRVTGNKRP